MGHGSVYISMLQYFYVMELLVYPQDFAAVYLMTEYTAGCHDSINRSDSIQVERLFL